MKLYVIINGCGKILATESIAKALTYVNRHQLESIYMYTVKTEDFPVIDELEEETMHAYSFVVNRDDGEIISSRELAIDTGFIYCRLFDGKFQAYMNRPSVYDIWIIAKDYEEACKIVDFKYKHRFDLDLISQVITGFTPKNSGRYPWPKEADNEEVQNQQNGEN